MGCLPNSGTDSHNLNTVSTQAKKVEPELNADLEERPQQERAKRPNADEQHPTNHIEIGRAVTATKRVSFVLVLH